MQQSLNGDPFVGQRFFGSGFWGGRPRGGVKAGRWRDPKIYKSQPAFGGGGQKKVFFFLARKWCGNALRHDGCRFPPVGRSNGPIWRGSNFLSRPLGRPQGHEPQSQGREPQSQPLEPRQNEVLKSDLQKRRPTKGSQEAKLCNHLRRYHLVQKRGETDTGTAQIRKSITTLRRTQTSAEPPQGCPAASRGGKVPRHEARRPHVRFSPRVIRFHTAVGQKRRRE